MSASGRVKGERGHNQFSSPVSIMSSPVSIDLRIKLLRDLPELQSDRCPGNASPDVTDTHHTAAQNTTDPFVTAALGTTRNPCPEFVVGHVAAHFSNSELLHTLQTLGKTLTSHP